MGRAMEIESYPGMLACVIAGSGVAMMSESMLASLPGRESVAVHPLPRAVCQRNHVVDVAQGHGRGQSECVDRGTASGLSVGAKPGPGDCMI
jgi:DNA-binding transcriptional LysR family regulator